MTNNISSRLPLQSLPVSSLDKNEIDKLILQPVSDQLESSSITLQVAERIPESKVKEQLSYLLANLLYLNETEIDVNEKFVDYGIDSILAVEFIKIINKTFVLDIPAARLYDYPTLAQLANHIVFEFSTKAPTLSFRIP